MRIKGADNNTRFLYQEPGVWCYRATQPSTTCHFSPVLLSGPVPYIVQKQMKGPNSVSKRTNWLYALLFLAFFDLHAQHPILPLYAYSLGASAAMLGVILAGYSAASMTGNVLAGPFIDRFGSKVFIVSSLCLAGILLLFQGLVDSPAELLSLRVITGFVLAFLSPACFALLGKQGRGLEEQGRIMAKNGMMITLASIISPVIGGYLADSLGFNNTFIFFGLLLILGGIMGLPIIREHRTPPLARGSIGPGEHSILAILANTSLLPAYLAAVTTSLGQGVLMYEVPYVMAKSGESSTATGLLLTVMGLGSLCTLSQGWLNRYSPYSRCFIALTTIAALFYILAIQLPVPLALLLFVKGAAHGLLFPAKTTILTAAASPDNYGKVFGIHSAVLSSGYVVGPMIAGTLRTFVSPFFTAFVFTMTMIVLFIAMTAKSRIAPVAWRG